MKYHAWISCCEFLKSEPQFQNMKIVVYRTWSSIGTVNCSIKKLKIIKTPKNSGIMEQKIQHKLYFEMKKKKKA